MDALLARATQHAVHYAVRSGLSITAGYAIKQCGRFLETAPKGEEKEELLELHARLESRVRILSPSIDLIELIAARGNTTLDSAVSLTKDIRHEFQQLGESLNQLTDDRSYRNALGRDHTNKLKITGSRIKDLVSRIDDAVPLINLAISTSGANLSTHLSSNTSPSRLLQASAFLTTADTRFVNSPNVRQQVGPTLILSTYMLFAGHASRAASETIRDTTWKEIIHKTHVKLWRVPFQDLCQVSANSTALPIDPTRHSYGDFVYQLVVVEDLDDGRVHESDGSVGEGVSGARSFDGIERAGIRDVIPIHQVAKVFYADTGKLLNLHNDLDSSNPVLLLRRDTQADAPLCASKYFPSEYKSRHVSQPPEDTSKKSINLCPVEAKVTGASQGLPIDLDPERIAFEVYAEDEAFDSESDTGEVATPLFDVSRAFLSPDISRAFSRSPLRSPSSAPLSPRSPPVNCGSETRLPSLSSFSSSKDIVKGSSVKSSLSLLEVLIKLCALQQFRQDTHLAIEDELLNFFLEDSAVKEPRQSKQHHRRLRHEALRKVGFDPYDESPVNTRGEVNLQRVRSDTRVSGSLRDKMPSTPPAVGRGISPFPTSSDEELRQPSFDVLTLKGDEALDSPSPQYFAKNLAL